MTFSDAAVPVVSGMVECDRISDAAVPMYWDVMTSGVDLYSDSDVAS